LRPEWHAAALLALQRHVPFAHHADGGGAGPEHGVLWLAVPWAERGIER